MKIEATWSQPIPLHRAQDGLLIYTLDMSQLPQDPAVYVFGRKHGKTIAPIYIGETLTLRTRIGNHLKSLPLMRGIEQSSSGARFLIYCTVKAGTFEKAKEYVGVLGRALILHAQGDGWELLKKKARRKSGVTIAPPVSTGPTKLLPLSGLFLSPADPLLA